ATKSAPLGRIFLTTSNDFPLTVHPFSAGCPYSAFRTPNSALKGASHVRIPQTATFRPRHRNLRVRPHPALLHLAHGRPPQHLPDPRPPDHPPGVQLAGSLPPAPGPARQRAGNPLSPGNRGRSLPASARGSHAPLARHS